MRFLSEYKHISSKEYFTPKRENSELVSEWREDFAKDVYWSDISTILFTCMYIHEMLNIGPTLVRHWQNIIFRNHPELASGSRRYSQASLADFSV